MKVKGSNNSKAISKATGNKELAPYEKLKLHMWSVLETFVACSLIVAHQKETETCKLNLIFINDISTSYHHNI